MFRIFGIIHDEKEEEILVNLFQVSIIHVADGKTYITMMDGNEYESSVEYKYIAAELDKVRM